MLHPSLSSPILILLQAQSSSEQGESARDLLWPTFQRLLWKLTRQTCRRYSLQGQEHEDVFAEAFHQVVNPAFVRFTLGRGKPAAYLVGLVQNAAHKVQTQQARSRRSDPADGAFHSRQMPRRGAASVSEDRPVLEEGFAALERRDSVEFILAQAPPLIRRALELYYWKDVPLVQVAKRLGLNRFTLNRRIEAFFREVQSQLELN